MTLPKAKTRNVAGRRHYVVIHDGVEFLCPSASTLVSQLDKPAIAGWMVNTHLNKAHAMHRKAANIDADDFRAIIRSAVRRDGSPAAESGSRAHEVLEAYFTGQVPPDYDETPWCMEHAEAIEDEMQLDPLWLAADGYPRSGVELTVVRIEDGVPIWAGTSDFIGSWVIDGETFRGCVDWKSGESGLWPDSILSTSVYSGATHWLDEDGTAIEFDEPLTAGALVWIRPEGYAFVPISPEETAEAVEVCRSLAIVARWKLLNERVADPVNADPIVKVP